LQNLELLFKTKFKRCTSLKAMYEDTLIVETKANMAADKNKNTIIWLFISISSGKKQ